MRDKTSRLVPRGRARLCAATLAGLLAIAALGHAQEASSPAALPTLDAQFEPLRAAFNRDADKVRLLLLLDPT